ncbi:polyunsaturated fatty acid lipoxygenase ALOX15B-like [Pempheris klunzingeri]|uniref:polyunsaturated fatty acid lipoxygenase ALOX15B-like n=1 Tax=Pempheris klunzingeri TaxID=3127111 RepID=UPI00397EAE30
MCLKHYFSRASRVVYGSRGSCSVIKISVGTVPSAVTEACLSEEDHLLLIDHWKKELLLKKRFYQWKIMAEGLSYINSFNNPSELPAEVRISQSKSTEVLNAKRITGIELKFKGLLGSTEKWESIEDMKRIFWYKKTILSEYVTEHWMEDDFYGSQFLNGINPNVIKRCLELPPNFPVTEEMVKLFLEEGSSLQMEMGKGNIFLCDQKKMDGIPGRVYDGEPLHVTAGLCLLYLTPENKLKPIPIQLHQQPSEQNPIFLPSDLETDWLLAKMSHVLYDRMTELMKRALSEMTYSSLCLPENITERGLESIPNFYYRDYGLKLWNIINSFVKAIVEHYYPSDGEVQKDTELQEWISEIFICGFLGNKASGFNTVEEGIKFITMVIFTATAQHAAVNNGQFDYYSWVPNCPLLLRKPPPTTKGQSSMKTILETLPNVGETVSFAAMVWLLSNEYTDVVPLGTYPEERFDEPAPKQMIKEFQAELSYLSEAITARNSQLEVPYTYLNPSQIENSITI